MDLLNHATKIHVSEYRMSFVLLILSLVFKLNLKNLNLCVEINVLSPW